MQALDTLAQASTDASARLRGTADELAQALANGLPEWNADAERDFAAGLTLLADLAAAEAAAAREADGLLRLAVTDRNAVAGRYEAALGALYATSVRARRLVRGSFGKDTEAWAAGAGPTPRTRGEVVAWALRFARRLRDDAGAWVLVPTAGAVDREALAAELDEAGRRVVDARAALDACEGRVARLAVERRARAARMRDVRVGMAAVARGVGALARPGLGERRRAKPVRRGAWSGCGRQPCAGTVVEERLVLPVVRATGPPSLARTEPSVPAWRSTWGERGMGRQFALA